MGRCGEADAAAGFRSTAGAAAGLRITGFEAAVDSATVVLPRSRFLGGLSVASAFGASAASSCAASAF
eukprot:7114849-Alexandrium_andersonii.AAC.1